MAKFYQFPICIISTSWFSLSLFFSHCDVHLSAFFQIKRPAMAIALPTPTATISSRRSFYWALRMFAIYAFLWLLTIFFNIGTLMDVIESFNTYSKFILFIMYRNEIWNYFKERLFQIWFTGLNKISKFLNTCLSPLFLKTPVCIYHNPNKAKYKVLSEMKQLCP